MHYYLVSEFSLNLAIYQNKKKYMRRTCAKRQSAVCQRACFPLHYTFEHLKPRNYMQHDLGVSSPTSGKQISLLIMSSVNTTFIFKFKSNFDNFLNAGQGSTNVNARTQ